MRMFAMRALHAWRHPSVIEILEILYATFIGTHPFIWTWHSAPFMQAWGSLKRLSFNSV